ncbi:MAG: hypothetical protein QOI06_1793 [Nocardioidaceae bacterium]|jgi:hypothetical protein|nr:hypothetical protein [Nocardioidaceae bacterium]
MPALLYADRVTVICPRSDDVIEMSDYFKLMEALPDACAFHALDSGYLDATWQARFPNENPTMMDYGPYAPGVFYSLANQYVSTARSALEAGDETEAVRAISCLLALLKGGAYELDVGGFFRTNLPPLDEDIWEAAFHLESDARAEVIPQWLLGAYLEHARRPGNYALLDDKSRLLSNPARAVAGAEIKGWVARRMTEASLSTAILSGLPSPRTSETWDVVADLRNHLAESLRRFRSAMAELSLAADSHPLEEDFDAYFESIWRIRIAPAIQEVEELSREAQLRSVFFDDVLGDLTAYAGPFLGISAALQGTLPALASAAIAGASPALSTFAHRRTRRKALQHHEFFFVQEARSRVKGR